MKTKMKTKMKTTLLLLLSPLLLFFVAHADASGETEFKLKCPKKPVEAHVGENVTLNCTSEPQHNLTKERIQWKLKDKNVLYYKGKNISPHQDEQFKGRVHNVSDWNVSEGKLSVEISSVKESDTGVYTCSVYNGPKCPVTLNVTKTAPNDSFTENPTGAQGGNNTTTNLPGDDSNNGAGTGIGAVAVVLVFAAFAAWLIYKYCRRKRGGERAQRVPAQDNQEDIPLQPVNTTQNQGGSSEADSLNERSQKAGE